MQGKLTSEELEKIVFKHLKFKRNDVLLRAALGEDCAALDFGEDALVISTDPITGASNQVGKLVVNVNLNDIAAAGATPIAMMLTVLAPEDATIDDVEQVIADASQEAAKYQVEIIGGHTEWTAAVNQIVVSAVALGKKKKTELLMRSEIAKGDLILMTKSAGCEGAGIIAYEHSDVLCEALGEETVAEAKALLDNTSVVREGIIAGKYSIKAMHDVTEGGLLGAVWELCQGADVGCIIKAENIPISVAAAKICDYYEIDPLQLISSGSMLIIAESKVANDLMKALDEAEVGVQIIGKITESECIILDEDEWFTIPSPEGDALYDVI